MKNVNSSIQNTCPGEKIWIGLRQGSWRWSLGDKGFYGEKEFSNWTPDEPHFGETTQPTEKHCVAIKDNQQQYYPCERLFNPLCYDEKNSTHPYVLVYNGRNWTDAQRYCRENHTDLASVRNQTESERIAEAIGSHDGQVWIGLFRDAWDWSDGSKSSFRHWGDWEPNYGANNRNFCVEISSTGRWNDHNCDKSRYFICYEDKLVLVREQKSWMEALLYCREHHEDLVSVSSERTQRWVEARAIGASSSHVWLGLRHSCNFAFWYWVSGDRICYDNWAPGAERTPGCDMAVGAVGRDGGQWISLSDTQELNFICSTNA
ncbi:C-type mannose receptor 2-like [Engraulis encrasicolus]|uniref:C-type mannose receptor 2-like n=1 Tax=Engraulis encrasicolus TaxID=184585 RepID=UPI002FD2B391